MIMIGYESGSKAYRAYNPSTKKVCVTRDVVFEEERSWNWDAADLNESNSNEIFHVVYSYVEQAERGVDCGKSGTPTASGGNISSATAGKGGETPAAAGKSPETAAAAEIGRAHV